MLIIKKQEFEDDVVKYLYNKCTKAQIVGRQQPRIIMTKRQYLMYLTTKRWRFAKDKVLKRDNYRCTQCSSEKRIEVHHLSYEWLFYEYLHLETLTTLCHKCHKTEHKKLKELKALKHASRRSSNRK